MYYVVLHIQKSIVLSNFITILFNIIHKVAVCLDVKFNFDSKKNNFLVSTIRIISFQNLNK